MINFQENSTMQSQIITEAARQMAYLPHSLQERVLGYIIALMPSVEHGVHGRNLLKYSGAIAQDDLQAMRDAIEESCGRIDRHEW
jgi:hypothetical protein